MGHMLHGRRFPASGAVSKMSLLDPESRKQLKLAARVSGVGLEIVLAMGVGFLGGRGLDGRFDTSPWLASIGFLLGVFTGFWF